MERVNLRFRHFEMVDPRHGNRPLLVIRLVADVCYRLPDKTYTETYEAICDTGAYLSVLPKYLWQPLEKQVIATGVYFGGVSRRRSCQIRSDFGYVACFLRSRSGNRTREYEIPAFLAHTDQVPLLIGFAGLLEKLRVCFDYEGSEAWIEEREQPMSRE